MLPYFAVGLLSGIRPDGVKRLNTWEHFSLEGEQAYIVVPDRASKTKRHLAHIPDNLRIILKACKDRDLSPSEYNYQDFTNIRTNAGVVDPETWVNDVMCHTFASMHHAVHVNITYLANIMGTSEAVLRRNYIAPIDPNEAKKFSLFYVITGTGEIK